MSESNGYGVLQGFHGGLPSPLGRGSQPAGSVGGFILTLRLLFHINEKGAAVNQLAHTRLQTTIFTRTTRI